jgi:purine-binding chemotaxis protein CheW
MQASVQPDIDYILVFLSCGSTHALPLAVVEKVELAAEITFVPEAPPAMLGALDWRGKVIPVLSMRRRLKAPERDILPNDRIIVMRIDSRFAALVVDEVIGVRQKARKAFIGAVEITEGLEGVIGAERTEDGIVLIHDMRSYLAGTEGFKWEK